MCSSGNLSSFLWTDILPGLSMKLHCPRPAISILLRKRTVGVMLDSKICGEFSAEVRLASGYRQKHLPTGKKSVKLLHLNFAFVYFAFLK